MLAEQANEVICLGDTRNGTEQIYKFLTIFVCHLPFAINLIKTNVYTPVLVTVHNGLHAYVNRNNYPLKVNILVPTKKIPFERFTVDIFASIDKHKMSDGQLNGIKENREMLPVSVIHDDNYEQMQIEYKYPRAPEGFLDSKILSSLWDILAS
ncbi:MAG: hypothetical protein EZS28_020683 [Streblomastix strix]|uniref:Uncharacterized protein n=1 Tax=Streblomastix strix TaxID=222440 RepID=A0A5J4VMP7_9EUKA|nr:MAG: hypothetical protein EZS28_020683 [Streblomastix strix]